MTLLFTRYHHLSIDFFIVTNSYQALYTSLVKHFNLADCFLRMGIIKRNCPNTYHFKSWCEFKALYFIEMKSLIYDIWLQITPFEIQWQMIISCIREQIKFWKICFICDVCTIFTTHNPLKIQIISKWNFFAESIEPLFNYSKITVS